MVLNSDRTLAQRFKCQGVPQGMASWVLPCLTRSGRTWLWDSFLFSNGKTDCRLTVSPLSNCQGEDIFRELPLHQEETEGALGRTLSSPGRLPILL